MEKNNWISVEERLPEAGANKNYPKASKDLLIANKKEVRIAYYEDGQWIDAKTDESFEDDFIPTHWQPLPLPPNPLIKQ